MSDNKISPYIPQNEAEEKLVYNTVKSILLSKCVEIFSSFENDREKGRYRKDEIPPKDAIVYLEKYSDGKKDAAEFEKTGIPPVTVHLCAWHLEKGKLTELDDPNTIADQDWTKTKDMYYKQATFHIKVDTENAKGYFSFTMGPLFGRGFVVDIRRTGDTPYIGEARMQWIS